MALAGYTAYRSITAQKSMLMAWLGESVWAVLKRGYNGIYHNWSRKHMTRYINEFSFRLNEGSCAIDTQDWLDSLFSAMAGKTIAYKELTA